MASERQAASADLEAFRGYLRGLATLRMDAAVRKLIDPSDVVQDTMLRAHKAFDQFRGTGQREMAGWLRQILANTLADAMRRHRTSKRDHALERELQAALDDSSARLEHLLAADQETPSEQVMHAERLARLTQAIDELPEDQREAVTMHHLESQSLAAVAERMERSPASVAGLLRRGIVALWKKLEAEG